MPDEVKTTDTTPTTPVAESDSSVVKQTTKAMVRPAILLSAITAVIPQPYLNYTYLAWLFIVIACWDLRPPTRGGRWQPALMLAYKALNFVACNPQFAVQGLESSVMFKNAGSKDASAAKVTEKTDG